MTGWQMTFIISSMFTMVMAGQFVLWCFRSLLPCDKWEKEVRIMLLRGTTLLLAILLLCEAGMILAHLGGYISLAGIL